MIVKTLGYHSTDGDAGAALVAHLKYLVHRLRGPGEPQRQLFNDEGTVMNRHAAARELRPAFGKSIAYQKLVLSPKDDERARLDARGTEAWQAWTRDVMKGLSQRVGKDLKWIATKHANTKHPHVHVVVAGKGIPQPKTMRSGSGITRGENTQVQFRKGDFRAAERQGRELAGIHERPEVVEQLKLFRDQDRAIVEREHIRAHERDISNARERDR